MNVDEVEVVHLNTKGARWGRKLEIQVSQRRTDAEASDQSGIRPIALFRCSTGTGSPRLGASCCTSSFSRLSMLSAYSFGAGEVATGRCPTRIVHVAREQDLFSRQIPDQDVRIVAVAPGQLFHDDRSLSVGRG